MLISMKVNEYIAEFLRTQCITHVFEVAGGMITHLLDAIHQCNYTTIVSVHHEQSAAFAADAYGRATGKPGVALATSGPGATNLLTGIASCYFDSSPALFITGQVNTHEQKGVRQIRQLGFQETDIISMATPIVKKAFRIESSSEIETTFQEAYACAINGRPGPVLIDLPMNIQSQTIMVATIQPIHRQQFTPPPGLEHDLSKKLMLLSELIAQAQRPLVLVGGGVRGDMVKKMLLQWVELAQIPVVTSLLGLDNMPFDHPLRVGFIGTYGNRWANISLANADLLIVIGSRLDVRQTGADVASFCKNKRIIHVDCDEHEINNRLSDCIPIITDAFDFLNQSTEALSKTPSLPNEAWSQSIKTLKNCWPDVNELRDFSGINPNYFMHALSKCSDSARAFVADVGNHQMWAAQSLELRTHQLFLTSGGMGAMGFALPAAIGASLAMNKSPIVVISGDGSLQMNIQELQTIVRNQLPIKIIVINNNCLGMIRQFQDSYFAGRYQSTYWGYSAPDFSKIADAYGLRARSINLINEIGDAINWLWSQPEEPALLQVMVSHQINVYPKIAYGQPISEMEPFAKPMLMECT